MTGHKTYARHSGVKTDNRLSIPLIKRCIIAVLCHEGVDCPCEVSVLITDDLTIRAINCEFRGVDAATDVLSFPMQEFSPPGWSPPSRGALDIDTGLLPLGEIVLSAQRVGAQALEYGHSRERETAYLTIHASLHLLGYDHVDEAEGKALMRAREEEILSVLSVT